jgi:hypothetical protein
VNTWVRNPATGVAVRTSLTLTPAFTVVSTFNGNYTLTIPGFGATGPVFIGATANTATGQVASSMSILKAYAQANDWVNAGQTGTVSPGQPTSVTLATTNTVCAGNVATSTVAGGACARGTVALCVTCHNPASNEKNVRVTMGVDATEAYDNFIEVHYPRALNDCTACHVNGGENNVPDGSQAVAVTLDPGAAPWGNQIAEGGGVQAPPPSRSRPTPSSSARRTG